MPPPPAARRNEPPQRLRLFRREVGAGIVLAPPSLSDPARPIRAWWSRVDERPIVGDVHFEVELGVVRSGAMLRQYEDWETTVGPGQVWMCGMWEPHRYQAVGGPCEALVLLINPLALTSLAFAEAPAHPWLLPFTVEPRLRPQPPEPLRREVLDWTLRTRELVDAADPLSALTLRVRLLELLLLLWRDWTPPPRPPVAAADQQRIERAIELVFARPRGVTTAQAAAAAGFSRGRFDRVFADLMGQSFGGFAMSCRLHGVATDLLAGDDPLKLIAARRGFVDASHLIRRFRRAYGCTPAAWRRR